MFGGVNPSRWGNGQARVWEMSNDASVMATLFTRTMYPGANATVAADSWLSYSSTNSRHTAVLMRIRNVTAAAIPWTVSFYYSCYPSWDEVASAALNGANNWVCAATSGAASMQSLNLTLPAGRTSTLVIASASGAPSGGMRSNVLGFLADCLDLPAGLEFVDDLDTVTGNIWLH